MGNVKENIKTGMVDMKWGQGWFLLLIIFFAGCQGTRPSYLDSIQSGDIIFQRSPLIQHRVMGWISESRINHCGIIIKEDDQFFVLEVVDRVKKTPLKEWIKRGWDERFIVARVRSFSEINRNDIAITAKLFMGRLYDWKFSWDDNKLYNAEFVRKIYERSSSIYLGRIFRFRYSNLSPAYQDSLKKFPWQALENQEIITPQAILEYGSLKIVYTNF